MPVMFWFTPNKLSHSLCFKCSEETVRSPGLTLSQENPVLSETPCVYLTRVSVCGV